MHTEMVVQIMGGRRRALCAATTALLLVWFGCDGDRSPIRRVSALAAAGRPGQRALGRPTTLSQQERERHLMQRQATTRRRDQRLATTIPTPATVSTAIPNKRHSYSPKKPAIVNRHIRKELHPYCHSVWREIADPTRHVDHMRAWNQRGVAVTASRDNLVPKWVYTCDVGTRYRLVFVELEQVRECRAYFAQTIHPSTKNWGCELEHWWNPWHCKLPKGLTAKPSRAKVLKRLDAILHVWG